MTTCAYTLLLVTIIEGLVPGYSKQSSFMHTHTEIQILSYARILDPVIKIKLNIRSKLSVNQNLKRPFHAMGLSTIIMTFHNTLLNLQKCNEKHSRWSTGKHAPL